MKSVEPCVALVTSGVISQPRALQDMKTDHRPWALDVVEGEEGKILCICRCLKRNAGEVLCVSG